MTVGIAWIGKRADGREHLYVAADSRTRGVHVLDACPKILTLPRSDCVLCFAGDTFDAYPMMLQLTYAIAAHEPARERSLDITRLKEHLLHLFSDLIGQVKDAAVPFSRADAQFLFAGYSWLRRDFCIWTIHYLERDKKFAAREAASFHKRLRKAAFIGDWSTRLRAAVSRQLAQENGRTFYLEPLNILTTFLAKAGDADTIGGPPQLIRVTQHMNTRPLCVRWKGVDTLLGRPLFKYENVDYWTVDPLTGKFERPRKFGYRTSKPRDEDQE